MPKELLTRLNWDKVYPRFMEQCFDLAANCRKRGVDYFAISGYRSFTEQAKLYFQGRTAPGKIVTNAKPGFSAHNYGLAVDWCKDEDTNRAGLQPDWDLKDYIILKEEAEKLGLESGMSWKTFKEGPHVQLGEINLTKLKEIHDKEGLSAVWAYLDRLSLH